MKYQVVFCQIEHIKGSSGQTATTDPSGITCGPFHPTGCEQNAICMQMVNLQWTCTCPEES